MANCPEIKTADHELIISTALPDLCSRRVGDRSDGDRVHVDDVANWRCGRNSRIESRPLPELEAEQGPQSITVVPPTLVVLLDQLADALGLEIAPREASGIEQRVVK